MPVTYGGIDLTPPAFAPEIVGRWWHSHRVREYAVPGGRATSTFHLPTEPDRDAEPPRLGVLHWPTGAARYGVCHLLATGDELAAVLALPETSDLVLSDGRATVTAAGMRRLPARPISQRGERELYLLTLVDDRWGWWQTGAGEAPVNPTSWASLLTSLLALVGVLPTINTVPAAYSTPTPDRWSVGVAPVPLLVDAACRQCGLRLVRTLAGAVQLQAYAAALVFDALRWTAHQNEVMAGGRLALEEIGAAVPEAVDVVFDGGGVVRTESRTLAALTTALSPAVGFTGRTGLFRADPPATMQESERVAYADQAAADWYNWQSAQTDATFRGLRSLDPTGLDDCCEWVLTETETATRVIRPAFGDANVYGSVWSRDQSEPKYPACAGSGSGSGSGSGEVEPVVWYTRYLHLGAVSVRPGELLGPRHRLGYIGRQVTGGPHLHFALCDGGDPFLWPGTDFPVAGVAVDVYDWLGVPITGSHGGTLPPRDDRYTVDQLAFIEERFAFPLDGDGWVCHIGSPYHTLYDYYACDFDRPPFGDPAEAGEPVYSAAFGDDVLTTVVWTGFRGEAGWGVLLKHSRCGLPDSGDTGGDIGNEIDGTDPTYEGDPPPFPPGGDPHAPKGAYLPLVSRVCVGPLTAGTLVGRLPGTNGPMQEICIGSGLELGVDGTLTATGGGGAAARWYDGTGAPDAGLGADGDYYLDAATGDVYAKAGGSWSVVANIKGPTGATGATGATGPAGADGADGEGYSAGFIADFAGTSAPSGWLACDGSAVSRTTYADLFAVISTTWGAGNGSTTFNLPDLRRRVRVGSGGTGTGTLGNAVGNTGGAETHTLAVSEMPSHSHSLSSGGTNIWADGTTFTIGTTGPAVLRVGTLQNTGGGGSHNNLQPSAVVLTCIKT